MNRESQIRQTLPHNLKVLETFGDQAELCFVNFIRDEDSLKIDGWIKDLGAPRIFRYYSTRHLEYWHASAAKNTAHMAATSQYVINLDGDNFLYHDEVSALLSYSDEDLSRAIYWAFAGSVEKRTQWRFNKNLRITYKARAHPGSHREGSYGRIGMPKKDFIALGGYDETLPPMGGQDYNLFKRLVAARPHYQLIHVPAKIKPLRNTKQEGLRYTQHPHASWNEWNAQCRNATREAVKKGRLVANPGKPLGVQVEKVF